MIKKSLFALAMAGASCLASAAGIYDGVYQAKGSTGYLVVLQNGSTLGVAAMVSISTSGVQFSASGGKVSPPQTNVWTVSLGAISGNTATVSGTTDYGACTATTKFTFDGAGNVTVAGQGATPTAFGTASGYNCAVGATDTGTLSKIF